MIGGLGLLSPGKRRRVVLGVDVPSNVARLDASVSIEGRR
jgi:hypothetical protein